MKILLAADGSESGGAIEIESRVGGARYGGSD